MFHAHSMLNTSSRVKPAAAAGRRWVATSLSRPYEVWYNPHTQSIERVSSVDQVGAIVSSLQGQLIRLNSALHKMTF